jgi:hypothetical protein
MSNPKSVIDLAAGHALGRMAHLHGLTSGDSDRGSVGVYASRTRARRCRVVLVHLVTVVDAAGRLIQRGVVARQIECTPLPGYRLSRAVVRHLDAHPTVRQTLKLQLERMAATAQDLTGPAAAAAGRRIEALISQLEQLNLPPLWQASLFDRRIEQSARARRSSIADLQRHLRQRADSVSALTSQKTLEPQLVAAWLE